jgi:hypothetical protein
MINNPQDQPSKIKVRHDPGGLMEEEDLFEPPTQPEPDPRQAEHSGGDTPVSEAAALERYEAALASGLSDYEAREEGWPTRP